MVSPAIRAQLDMITQFVPEGPETAHLNALIHNMCRPLATGAADIYTERCRLLTLSNTTGANDRDLVPTQPTDFAAVIRRAADARKRRAKAKRLRQQALVEARTHGRPTQTALVEDSPVRLPTRRLRKNILDESDTHITMTNNTDDNTNTNMKLHDAIDVNVHDITYVSDASPTGDGDDGDSAAPVRPLASTGTRREQMSRIVMRLSGVRPITTFFRPIKVIGDSEDERKGIG